MDSPKLNTLNQKYIFFYHGIWIETKPIAAGGATKNALRLFKYDEHTKLLYNENAEDEEKNNIIMKDIVNTIKKNQYSNFSQWTFNEIKYISCLVLLYE